MIGDVECDDGDDHRLAADHQRLDRGARQHHFGRQFLARADRQRDVVAQHAAPRAVEKATEHRLGHRRALTQRDAHHQAGRRHRPLVHQVERETDRHMIGREPDAADVERHADHGALFVRGARD